MKTGHYIPEWLLEGRVIIGAEGENGSDDNEGDDDQSGNAGSSEDGQNGSQGGEHDDADDPKVRGLKSALAAEREANKQREAELKELRKLKRAQEERELKEKSELEQEKIRRERLEEQTQKLASGFRRNALETAIRDAAKEAKFIDVDDALAGVDRNAITLEQDEDDPSVITIDLKSVKAAVKDLAGRKPHFIQKGTDDGHPTGSQFGGSPAGRKDPKDLHAIYPGL